MECVCRLFSPEKPGRFRRKQSRVQRVQVPVTRPIKHRAAVGADDWRRLNCVRQLFDRHEFPELFPPVFIHCRKRFEVPSVDADVQLAAVGGHCWGCHRFLTSFARHVFHPHLLACCRVDAEQAAVVICKENSILLAVQKGLPVNPNAVAVDGGCESPR